MCVILAQQRPPSSVFKHHNMKLVISQVAEGVDREAMARQLLLEPPGQACSVSARESLENMNARRVCVCVCVPATAGPDVYEHRHS